MMHTREMKDSDGDFSEWTRAVGEVCRKCGHVGLMFRKWDSHCGGYTDLQFRCESCGVMFWVEGPDA